MHWHKIPEQAFAEIVDLSRQTPVFLFKHSPRCSISTAAMARIERQWQSGREAPVPYLVDVINERHLSNEIAGSLDIRHESPQALLLRNGRCIYHASHLDIRYSELMDALSEN